MKLDGYKIVSELYLGGENPAFITKAKSAVRSFIRGAGSDRTVMAKRAERLHKRGLGKSAEIKQNLRNKFHNWADSRPNPDLIPFQRPAGYGY